MPDFISDPLFPALDFPDYNLNVREKDKKFEIFDFIRKKYVSLTPEEWVRQHTLHFLHHKLHIPAGIIIVEKSLTLNTLSKRADILVYGKILNPLMLIECKAPSVKITQAVFDQISRYNLVFKVQYLMITNGIQHFSFKADFNEMKIISMDHFPDWDEMNLEKEV